jgi:hypothetical protein
LSDPPQICVLDPEADRGIAEHHEIAGIVARDPQIAERPHRLSLSEIKSGRIDGANL